MIISGTVHNANHGILLNEVNVIYEIQKIFLCVCILFAMVDAEEHQLAQAENLYYSDQMSELQSTLPALLESFPNHSSVMFYQALFENDAEKALSLYNTIHNQHPHSKFADDALFRVGQFYHTKGQLDKADSVYNELLSVYPKSDILDEVAYAQCQGLLDREKYDSAKTHLRHFLQFFPRSELTDAAVWDLENLQQDIDKETLREAVEQKHVYSVQIGVLRHLNNAKRVQRELGEKFNDVHIREQQLGNDKLYALSIGQFDKREKAEQFAIRFIAPHLDEYKIIKKKVSLNE